MLSRVKRILTRDRIIEALKRRIAAGVYSEGSLLPTERELTEEFHTSRTAVSQAITELQRQGFIERARRRGTRVLNIGERPARTGVAVLLPSPPSHPESTRLLQGIQDTLVRHNQHFDLLFADNLGADVAACIEKQYAGAIFMEGLGFVEYAKAFELHRFPYVIANLETTEKLACTWVDHKKTTRTAVRLLAAMGHRAIGLLTRPSRQLFYGEAYEGFREGMSELQVSDVGSLMITVEEEGAIAAYTCMRTFLATERAPTALIAARDYLAHGACQALAEKNLTPGRDISIIGFDDLSWPQDKPFLTTFREPAMELGAVATDMLLERMISGWQPAERREIEAPLVLRRSAGICPCVDDNAAEFPAMLLGVWHPSTNATPQGRASTAQDSPTV